MIPPSTAIKIIVRKSLAHGRMTLCSCETIVGILDNNSVASLVIIACLANIRCDDAKVDCNMLRKCCLRGLKIYLIVIQYR